MSHMSHAGTERLAGAATAKDSLREAGVPRQLLSVVLPAYNEQDVLQLTYDRFTGVGPQLAEMGLDYELVFVNDGSRDRTPEMLDALAARDPHVHAVHLTRNFGHQAAISAGLQVARG